MEFWSVSIGDVAVSICDAGVVIVFPPAAVVGPADWFGIRNMKIMTNRSILLISALLSVPATRKE